MKRVCYIIGITVLFLCIFLVGLKRRGEREEQAVAPSNISVRDEPEDYVEEDISIATDGDADRYAEKNEDNVYTMSDGACVYDGFAYEIVEAKMYDSLDEFMQMDGYNEEYHNLHKFWTEEDKTVSVIVYVKYKLTNISDSAYRDLNITQLGVAYVNEAGETSGGIDSYGAGPYIEAIYATIPENAIDEKNFDCPRLAPQETIELEIAFLNTGINKDGVWCKPYEMYDGEWYFTSEGYNICMTTVYNIYEDTEHIKIKMDMD
ncbi:MAG: hypothetical protein E7258_02015 [Lachnospiraceae bacterium]|nr:hypothetical protein [Lachnospiraceae bacterium]